MVEVQIPFSRMDFGQHMEVASLEATEEMMAVASFPQAHRFQQPRGHIPILALNI